MSSTFLNVVTIISAVTNGVLFYFLNRRQSKMDTNVASKLAELEQSLQIANSNCRTLRANEDTLKKDLEFLGNEIRKLQKKTKRTS